MTPFAFAKLAGVLVLVGAGAAGVLSYRHLAAKAATADTRIAAAEKATAELKQQFDVLNAEAIRRAQVDQMIRDTRAQVSHNLDTIQREDPVARDYLGEPLPISVRDAIRNVQPVPPTDSH